MEHLSHNQDKARDNRANLLNQECYCRTLDRKALNTSLQNQLSDVRDNPIGANELSKLFSATPVFVPKTEIEAMVRIVEAIESAVRLSSYQQQVLSWAPNIAAFDLGPIGAFMGYDFHLGSDGPKLIEINTNAGGAFLNVALARAQKRCCRPSEQSFATSQMLDGFEEAKVKNYLTCLG